MKKLFAILLVVVMVFALAACGEKEPENKDPIIIGVLDAFTGDRANNGTYVQEGTQMLVEKINAEGGLLGRELQVVYGDDQGNETAATNAYQKLVAENELAGTVLNKYSSVVLAMADFVADEQLPAICAGSSVKLDALEGNNYLYSVRKSDYGQATSIAKACSELGMTKVCILHAPDALGTSLAPLVTEYLKEYGIEVISTQQFTADEKNFTPYLTKIAGTGCDGLLCFSQNTESSLIMKAVADAGITVPCIGNSSYAQKVTIDAAGDAANGWYAPTFWIATNTLEPAASWIAEYTTKYGHAPDSSSALSYDALYLLCWAIEEAGSADPEDVNNALRTMKDVQGIIASYSYTEGTRFLSTSEFLIQVRDGQPVVIG